ncbi:hypothetical protein AVEN_244571-1 [Araneus ventricosus]|uniref:Uncharacterized protein n=1 Tax=Araneus ventricosus TaxID=182803 RepID=A0A4Y2LS72_ARAVE|nr:hypothetical protein AVEN_244571-1 [Araneus ventricosus]
MIKAIHFTKKRFHRDGVDVCQLFIINHLQKWKPGRPNFDPTCCPCCVGRIFSYGVDVSKPNLDDVAMSWIFCPRSKNSILYYYWAFLGILV